MAEVTGVPAEHRRVVTDDASTSDFSPPVSVNPPQVTPNSAACRWNAFS